ncbi:hypothetical protein NKM76_000137 [Salmonella enterica]|nr:hypothetical protein [Salmonella enterica]
MQHATVALKHNVDFWRNQCGYNEEQINREVTRWHPIAFCHQEISRAKSVYIVQRKAGGAWEEIEGVLISEEWDIQAALTDLGINA